MVEAKCPNCGLTIIAETTYSYSRFAGYVHQFICSECKSIFEHLERDGEPNVCPECGAKPKRFKHWRIASGCPKCGHRLELTGEFILVD